MSGEMCHKCGGFKNPPEDMSPTLWCDCPLWDTKPPFVDSGLDPSDPDYPEIGYNTWPYDSEEDPAPCDSEVQPEEKK